MRRAALAVCLLLAACQPVEEAVPRAPRTASAAAAAAAAEGATSSPTPRLGAPDEGVPPTLPEALARTDRVAREWQAGPRLTQLRVVTGGAVLALVEATYVAPEADRFLVVTLTPDGDEQQRTTLDALGLVPVTEEALDEVPDLPAVVLDPFALLAACGSDAAELLVLSGAPEAWDGETWEPAPRWRALPGEETRDCLAP